jgi:hypothetical protein
MATPEERTGVEIDSTGVHKTSDTAPVEFIELGLSLELLLDSHPSFAEAVKAAIEPLDGELLFDLPYSESPDSLGRVAAVRLPYAGSAEPRLAFIFLSDDAAETRIEPAEGQVEHLRNFANSFVEVIEKIAAH